MRIYRLKRETSEGTFGLYNAQLTVGELSDVAGNRLKGFGILEPNSIFEYPVALTSNQAADWVTCLEQVLRRELPAAFKFRYGLWNMVGWSFNFKKFDEKWFGGGAYKGSLVWSAPFALKWLNITMSEEAVRGLKDCLVRFYALKRMQA